MTGYNVALRYKPHVQGYAGVITWSDYGTKEALDAFLAKDEDHEVVEEGIDEERAIQLCKKTPQRCHIAVAIFEATNPETGEVYPELIRSSSRALSALY